MQRLFQMIQSREKSEDVEAHGDRVIQKLAYNKRLEFIESLFDVNSEVLANFPGIESYCDYLEHDTFKPLMGPAFGFIWELISCTNLKEITDCWDWSLAVLQVTQSEHPEMSIHDISRRLEEQSGSSKKNIGRNHDNSYLYIAIFGVLCWSSLVVRPKLIFTDDVPPNLTCLLPHGLKSTKSSTTHRISDRCRRPILTTFRTFKLQNWGDQSDERTEGGSRPGNGQPVRDKPQHLLATLLWARHDSMGRYYQRASTVQSSQSPAVLVSLSHILRLACYPWRQRLLGDSKV